MRIHKNWLMGKPGAHQQLDPGDGWQSLSICGLAPLVGEFCARESLAIRNMQATASARNCLARTSFVVFPPLRILSVSLREGVVGGRPFMALGFPML